MRSQNAPTCYYENDKLSEGNGKTIVQYTRGRKREENRLLITKNNQPRRTISPTERFVLSANLKRLQPTTTVVCGRCKSYPASMGHISSSYSAAGNVSHNQGPCPTPRQRNSSTTSSTATTTTIIIPEHRRRRR